MSKPPAVILSGNIIEKSHALTLNEAALALTRSLGRRGVTVYRFHPNRSLADLRSRYCKHVGCPNLFEKPADAALALVDFAKQLGTRPVLFPACDGSAKFIAAHGEALGRVFALTSPDAACISRTQNKEALLKAARTAGIGIPETYFPPSMADLQAIAQRMPFPAVIKPIQSSDWRRSAARSSLGGAKAITVGNAAALIDAGRKVFELDTPFMVQEIIPGPEESLLTFIGYVGRDGRTLAGCVRKKLRQFPADFGYCALTETVEDPEIVELSAQLLGALDYRGVACVEFKRDSRTGQAKLVEINTRAVRTSALPVAAGVDFPWIAYQDSVSPGSVQPALAYEVPVRWVHLYDEIKAAGTLMWQGRLSVLGWLAGFRGKRLVIAEFSWDDVIPGFRYWAGTPFRILRTMLPRRKTQSRAAGGVNTEAHL